MSLFLRRELNEKFAVRFARFAERHLIMAREAEDNATMRTLWTLDEVGLCVSLAYSGDDVELYTRTVRKGFAILTPLDSAHGIDLSLPGKITSWKFLLSHPEGHLDLRQVVFLTAFFQSLHREPTRPISL